MQIKNNRFRLMEIMFFNIILSMFAFIIGYAAFDILFNNQILDFDVDADALSQISNTTSDMFFKNNFLFFLAISFLPIINTIFLFLQFFRLGNYAFSIKSMTINEQFVLLYRHTIFEVFALILSVYISYRILFMVNAFTQNHTVDKKYYKKSFIKISTSIFLVFLSTLIGAILEGNAYDYFQ